MGVVAGLLSIPTFAQDELPGARAAYDGRPTSPPGLQAEDLWSSVSVGLPGEGGQVADPETAPRPAGEARPQPAPGEPSRELLRRPSSDRSFLRAQPSDGRAGSPWLRTTGALAAVVALIFLLGWGYRAMSSGRLPFPGRVRRPGLIEVISRTALSPKHSLHLVRVGPRLVLVGVSSDSLVALDVVSDAEAAARLAGQAAMQRPDGRVRDFTRCLETEAAGYQERNEGSDETVIPEEGRLLDIKRQLSGTIQRVRAAVGGV